MRRDTKLFVRAILLAALVLACRSAVAATYTGCLNCEEHNVGGTIPADVCAMAGDGGTGYTGCTEEYIGIFRYCTLSGQACYNVDVDGGGGGGTGGGGTGGSGGGCTIGPAAGCPAQCASCQRSPFLN